MKDPCVLFYSQDFLTGTMLLNYEQKGKYITLLCLQHQNGGLTEKDMLKICGEYDDDIFKKFEIIDGFYYNKRMVLESERRKKYVESRKINLQKLHMDVHMDSHMEIRNKKYEIRNKKQENEIIIKMRVEKFKEEALQFIDKYPETILTKFISYWTEPNRSQTKLRYELEKTFEINRRLITWASRDNSFKKIDEIKFKYYTYEEMLQKLDKAGGDSKFWQDYKKVKLDKLPQPVWVHINDIALYNLEIMK